MDKNELYCVVYTTDDETLVMKALKGDTPIFGYSPTGGSRLGTMVVGGTHIGMNERAKVLLQKINEEAKHTGDDLSCIDILAGETYDVAFGWMGALHMKLNLHTMHECGFWIGDGEGPWKMSALQHVTLLTDDEAVELGNTFKEDEG